ncbi:DNA polymerase III subunit chi [Amantichitinum ursilacus]|uniref:DNA polymerase III subunit chi n=1 Tax=Amantichitinum ursilacus TaxID=857265 RepID=A0A0N0XH36_9NEIS|nr:DNA polymerase III subunit chi [Amantichitinum ursilacus]KPC49139.1 DNA polymerase III subunit chi [Amantichitinum ursilacus]
MAEVTFYFNVRHREQALAQLAGKAMAQRLRINVLAADEAGALRLDRVLWDTPQIGFLPHCRADEDIASATPIVVDFRAEQLGARDVLFNFSGVVPPVSAQQHTRIIEIVSQDEDERLAARELWRAWQASGITPVAVDMLKLAPSPERMQSEAP